MDNRVNNKGTIGNKGGRPSKADEQKLIERLSPMDDKANAVLFENIENGERWAVELFFKYRYGMPRQMIDHTTNGNDIVSPVVAFKKFKSDGE